MSIKMKRSLLLASVLVICVSIWTIVIQNMTGSNSLSKPAFTSTNQQQKTIVNEELLIKEPEPEDNQELPNQQEDIASSNSNYRVPSEVEQPSINTLQEPEVSMNLDYEQIVRIGPNVKIVAISDDKMASEEARQARKELEALVPQFNALFFIDAASENEIDILKLFLKAGMDPDAYVEVKEGSKSTALDLAVSNGHLDAARLLLENGANPNLLIEIKGGFKSTVLQTAVSNGRLDLARLLLENGANPNLLYDQFTIITLAVAKNNYDMVNELLKYGAEPDLNYQNFRSPLMRAVQDNRLHIAKLLLEHGADPLLATQYAPEHPTKLGSPIAEARMLGNREMIALLEAFIRD
ncbi:ankyrin repeat domain-containing protein [Brevibacillus sp. AG]|uniref:ankyrin repeat domain-containing protein n=1 Tax=Brevibacillus sp. AG TaxID=3020891 RepID=UPI00085314A8|nr:ankyrin repeat domain-containing protein [Brevibacillus sp. AG]MDC0762201.1 ankyrin repeat domain-containing protein [Brevibacillus sp. AG]